VFPRPNAKCYIELAVTVGEQRRTIELAVIELVEISKCRNAAGTLGASRATVQQIEKAKNNKWNI
jgi:hypothetical protein